MRPDALRRLVLAGLVAVSGAAGQVDDDEPTIYTVEVLVFRQADIREPAYRWPGEPSVANATDLVPDDEQGLPALPRDPRDRKAEDVARGVEGPAAFGDAASGLDSGPSRFDPEQPPAPLLPADQADGVELLETDAIRLDGALARLEASPNYVTLAHLAWRQPASPFGEPLPIRLRSRTKLGNRPEEPVFPAFEAPSEPQYALDGAVALERGRFLHLRLDLVLRVPVDSLGQDPALPAPLLAPDSPRGPEDHMVFRLRERRQISRDTLNYFDHRHFGLIAVVGEWTPPETESDDPPLSGPTGLR